MTMPTTELPVSGNRSAATIDPARSVNDTVLAFPTTLPVFAAYGLDTCCRGAMPVQDAALQSAVPLPQLLADLSAAVSAEMSRKETTPEQ